MGKVSEWADPSEVSMAPEPWLACMDHVLCRGEWGACCCCCCCWLPRNDCCRF